MHQPPRCFRPPFLRPPLQRRVVVFVCLPPIPRPFNSCHACHGFRDCILLISIKISLSSCRCVLYKCFSRKYRTLVQLATCPPLKCHRECILLLLRNALAVAFFRLLTSAFGRHLEGGVRRSSSRNLGHIFLEVPCTEEW